MQRPILIGIFATVFVITLIFISCNHKGMLASKQNLKGSVDLAITFPEIDPVLLGTATANIHDRYFTIGPDGQKYRTWHPQTVAVNPDDPNSAMVTFAHTHGDPPHPDAPLPCFGYVAFQSGLTEMIKAHQEYKVFTHKTGQMTGMDETELFPVTPDWDMQFWIHQGFSESEDADFFYRTAGFWAKDVDGNETEVYYMPDMDIWQDKDGTLVVEDNSVYNIRAYSVNIANVWDCPVSVAINDVEDVVYVSPNDHRLTLQNPDWEWLNENGREFFYTDVRGNLKPDSLAGEAGIIRQRVAPVDFFGGYSQAWERSYNSSVFGLRE